MKQLLFASCAASQVACKLARKGSGRLTISCMAQGAQASGNFHAQQASIPGNPPRTQPGTSAELEVRKSCRCGLLRKPVRLRTRSQACAPSSSDLFTGRSIPFSPFAEVLSANGGHDSQILSKFCLNSLPGSELSRLRRGPSTLEPGARGTCGNSWMQDHVGSWSWSWPWPGLSMSLSP